MSRGPGDGRRRRLGPGPPPAAPPPPSFLPRKSPGSGCTFGSPLAARRKRAQPASPLPCPGIAVGPAPAVRRGDGTTTTAAPRARSPFLLPSTPRASTNAPPHGGIPWRPVRHSPPCYRWSIASASRPRLSPPHLPSAAARRRGGSTAGARREAASSEGRVRERTIQSILEGEGSGETWEPT